MKCDSTQDGYTSSSLLLAMAVHKLLVLSRAWYAREENFLRTDFEESGNTSKLSISLRLSASESRRYVVRLVQVQFAFLEVGCLVHTLDHAASKIRVKH